MSKKRNGVGNKGKFGLSTEDVQELRQIMRAAAIRHGEDTVALKLGFNQVSEACLAVHKDMNRTAFGNMRNAVSELNGPRVKVNKYKDKADARRQALG